MAEKKLLNHLQFGGVVDDSMGKEFVSMFANIALEDPEISRISKTYNISHQDICIIYTSMIKCLMPNPCIKCGFLLLVPTLFFMEPHRFEVLSKAIFQNSNNFDANERIKVLIYFSEISAKSTWESQTASQGEADFKNLSKVNSIQKQFEENNKNVKDFFSPFGKVVFLIFAVVIFLLFISLNKENSNPKFSKSEPAQENPSSNIDLAWMYFEKKEYKTSIQFSKKARSENFLESVFIEAVASDELLDRLKAIELYSLISDKDARAAYNLGRIYIFDKNHLNQKAGVQLIYFAAEKHLPEAENLMGALYHGGDILKKDLEKGSSYYLRSAERGNATAMYNLSMSFMLGDGLPRNKEKADFWMDKAIKNGYILQTPTEKDKKNAVKIKLYPLGIKIPNKPGIIKSPYSKEGYVDATDFNSGTIINCPFTGKPFEVP